MATSQVKQREYLLTVDQFSNPQVVEGKSAIALLLSRLMILEPGSDPLHPEMGVGIKNYRFNNNKDALLELKKIINEQLNIYLPNFQGSDVTLKFTEDKILNVNITIGDTTYVYTSETNDSIDTLNDIRAN
jgi:hypothetical protein